MDLDDLKFIFVLILDFIALCCLVLAAISIL